MEFETLNEEDMKPNRSSSSSSPTAKLRSAINKHEYVYEMVYTSETRPRIYECSINNGRLNRDRKKQLEKVKSWNNLNCPAFMKSQFKSLGTHTHTKSNYEHEIFVENDKRVRDAVIRMMKKESKKDIKMVEEEGWESLVKKYYNKVNYDYWDIDSLSGSGVRKYKLTPLLYDIIKYAKRNKLTIDSALTAMELKRDGFSQKLKDAFVSSTDENKLKIYRQALKAKRKRGDIN